MPPRQFAGTLICIRRRLNITKEVEYYHQYSLVHARYASKTSTSTHSATKQLASEDSVADKSVIRKNRGDRKAVLEVPNPLVWKRLLRTKRLGQDSSVIVLRDAEGNHVNRQAVTSPKNESHDGKPPVTADELINIVNKSNALPEQDDVNRRIEELRPKILYYDSDSCPVTSQSNYEQAALRLHAEFNAQQLSRYATKYDRGPIAKSTQHDLRPQMRASVRRVSKRITRLKWKKLIPGTDKTENMMSTKTQTTTRTNVLPLSYKSRKGKMGPVQAILVRVWNFRIAEESQGIGSIRLQLESELVNLLLVGGAKSSLHVLGKTFNVRVVRGLDGSIVITGTKDNCEMAADRIERLVDDRTVTVLDFGVLWKDGLSSAGQVCLQDLASKSRCTIAIDTSTKKVTVSSISAEDQQLFQRQLISSCELPPQSRQKSFTSTRGTTSGIVCHSSNSSSQYAFSAFPEQYGRFTTPFSVTDRILDHSRISSVAQISTDSIGDLVGFLDQDNEQSSESDSRSNNPNRGACSNGASESRQSEWSIASTYYQADFGHVLHYIQNGTSDHTTCRALLESEDVRHFSDELQGLRQFLFSTLSKTQHETQEVLSLQLIPSPWRVSAKAKHQAPNLEMKLFLDPETQSVRLKHLTAQSPDAQAFLLLPDHVTDLRVTRSTHQSFRNIDHHPAVKDFVRSINDSAAGYGQITPPSSLVLSVPISDDESSRSAVVTQKKHVEYVVKSLNFDQTLQFHYDPTFRLIYRKTSANMAAEVGESLSLHWQKLPAGTVIDGNRRSTFDFLSSASGIAQKLTRKSIISNITPRSVAPSQDQGQSAENVRRAAVG